MGRQGMGRQGRTREGPGGSRVRRRGLEGPQARRGRGNRGRAGRTTLPKLKSNRALCWVVLRAGEPSGHANFTAAQQRPAAVQHRTRAPSPRPRRAGRAAHPRCCYPQLIPFPCLPGPAAANGARGSALLTVIPASSSSHSVSTSLETVPIVHTSLVLAGTVSWASCRGKAIGRALEAAISARPGSQRPPPAPHRRLIAANLQYVGQIRVRRGEKALQREVRHCAAHERTALLSRGLLRMRQRFIPAVAPAPHAAAAARRARWMCDALCTVRGAQGFKPGPNTQGFETASVLQAFCEDLPVSQASRWLTLPLTGARWAPARPPRISSWVGRLPDPHRTAGRARVQWRWQTGGHWPQAAFGAVRAGQKGTCRSRRCKRGSGVRRNKGERGPTKRAQPGTRETGSQLPFD